MCCWQKPGWFPLCSPSLGAQLSLRREEHKNCSSSRKGYLAFLPFLCHFWEQLSSHLQESVTKQHRWAQPHFSGRHLQPTWAVIRNQAGCPQHPRVKACIHGQYLNSFHAHQATLIPGLRPQGLPSHCLAPSRLGISN